MALPGIPISEDECIGDSLATINNAFQILESGAGGAIVSDTPPPSGVSEGNLWYDSSSGIMSIYYDSQWVDVGGGDSGTSYWKQVSTTYTAIDGDRIAANTSGGPFTITLPASPTNASTVTIADSFGTWGTNNLTIARNGSTIEGLSENLVCEVEGKVTITLLYNGLTWRVYA
jgi:hypothetical protein